MRRITTVFGNKEFETIAAYCKRKRISLYALAKAAIREYVQRHSCPLNARPRQARPVPCRRQGKARAGVHSTFHRELGTSGEGV